MTEKEKKTELMRYMDGIKEKPILTNFPKKKRLVEPKNILFCDPEEVILQGIRSSFNYKRY